MQQSDKSAASLAAQHLHKFSNRNLRQADGFFLKNSSATPNMGADIQSFLIDAMPPKGYLK